MDLRGILKRLDMTSASNLELTPQSTSRSIQLDAFLMLCIRQSYLDRARLGAGAGKTSQGKRGRALQASQAYGADDGEAAWEWRWGPRAASEVGEAGIARFVAGFMADRLAGGDDENSDDETGDARMRRRRSEEHKKRLAALMKGIERAAGGELAEIV